MPYPRNAIGFNSYKQKHALAFMQYMHRLRLMLLTCFCSFHHKNSQVQVVLKEREKKKAFLIVTIRRRSYFDLKSPLMKNNVIMRYCKKQKKVSLFTSSRATRALRFQHWCQQGKIDLRSKKLNAAQRKSVRAVSLRSD